MTPKSATGDLAVTLIGPGAIGIALAGGLIDNGHLPTLVTRTPFDRLRCEYPDGVVNVEVNCVSDPAELAPADVIIIATKATQNGDIADHIRASIKPGSILVVAQNGVDQAERFDDIVTADVTVVPAVVMLPSERSAPGRALIGNTAKLTIPSSPAADVVHELFADSFIDIEITNDWLSAAWLKLLLNAASGGIGVISNRGSEVFHDVGAQELFLALMEEAALVGRAEGADLAPELPAQLQQYQIAHAGQHTSSIVLDRLAGRATEWRERNEVIVRLADKHGIPVPVNQTIATLMRLGEPNVG